VRNWSDDSHIIDIPFPLSLAELTKCICLKTQISPPLSIYYLGENKLLDARKKIVNDSDLANFLDKIICWNPFENPTLPEILFHFGPSPTSSPDKIYEKLSHSSRSGQAEYNAGILRRDLNCCVFCEATENLSVAHLLAYKEIRGLSFDTLLLPYKMLQMELPPAKTVMTSLTPTWLE